MRRLMDPRSNDIRFTEPHDMSTVRAPHHELSFAAGQTIYLCGDASTSLYRLDEGMVREARMTPDGGIVTVRHVLPGDLFGEEALNGELRSCLAEALTDVRIAAIDTDYLDATDMQVVTKSMLTQLQRMTAYSYHLQTGDLLQRVARYLVWLAGTPLRSEDDDGRTQVTVTHELIAEGTGSTRESVSKIITELRSEELIASGYRAIVLLDVTGLDMVAEGM